jgi:hypothetical protein
MTRRNLRGQESHRADGTPTVFGYFAPDTYIQCVQCITRLIGMCNAATVCVVPASVAYVAPCQHSCKLVKGFNPAAIIC